MARRPGIHWPTGPRTVFFDDAASAATLSKAVAEKRIRRLAPRIYSADLESSDGDIISKNCWKIVAKFLPGALIADRTAAEDGRVIDGRLFVVADTRRKTIRLSRLEVHIRPGHPYETPHQAVADTVWAEGLRLSSAPRTLLDNLEDSRQHGRGASRTLKLKGEDYHSQPCSSRCGKHCTAPRSGEFQPPCQPRPRRANWPSTRPISLMATDTELPRCTFQRNCRSTRATSPTTSKEPSSLWRRPGRSLIRSSLLRRGLSLVRGIAPGFRRALFVLFVVSEVHPFADGNGRVSRVMMNAELSHVAQSRIVIPNVFRNEYVASLRRASTENGNVEALARVLSYAWQWTAMMPWGDRAAAEGQLHATNALMDSSEAQQTGRRLELP